MEDISEDCEVCIPVITNTVSPACGNLTQEVADQDSYKPDLPQPAMERKTHWKSIKSTAQEFKTDSKKFYNMVKLQFRSQRNEKETKVQTIHISPDEDDFTWARRSVGGSATSRTSCDTVNSVGSNSHVVKRIEVVHDMAEEFGFEYDKSLSASQR